MPLNTSSIPAEVVIYNQSTNGTKYASVFPDNSAYAAISVITLFTNITVLILIITERKLHAMSNWILASMFCAGAVFAMAYLLPRWVFFYQWNIYYSYACLVLPMTGSALIINFNLHLALVSLDRYFCVTLPFEYQRPQTRMIVRLAILIVWFISFFIAYVPLFTFLIPSPGQCIAQLSSRLYHNYICTVFSILFFLPLIILITTYSRIFWIVNNHTQRSQGIIVRSNSTSISAFYRNVRAIKYMIVILGLFVIFWMPYIILFLAWFTTSKITVQTLFLIRAFQYLAFSYPAVNPILYAYFTPCIRHVIQKKVSGSFHSIAQTMARVS